MNKTDGNSENISFRVSNLPGMKKEISMGDLVKWQQGKNAHFTVRLFNQIKTLFSSDVMVTDGRVKEIMKKMDPDKMTEVNHIFQKALQEPTKAESKTLIEIGHQFSKHKLSSTMNAVDSVRELQKTLAATSAVKTLNKIDPTDLLKSLVLEGALNQKATGFTGIGKDFLEYCKNNNELPLGNKDIKEVYSRFVENSVSNGVFSNNKKALDQFFMFQGTSQSELADRLIGDDHIIYEIINKNPSELFDIIEHQEGRQNKNLASLNEAKEILKNPQEIEANLDKLIENPVQSDLLKKLLESERLGPQFKHVAKPGVDKSTDSYNKDRTAVLNLLMKPPAKDKYDAVIDAYPLALNEVLSNQPLVVKTAPKEKSSGEMSVNEKFKDIVDSIKVDTQKFVDFINDPKGLDIVIDISKPMYIDEHAVFAGDVKEYKDLVKNGKLDEAKTAANKIFDYIDALNITAPMREKIENNLSQYPEDLFDEARDHSVEVLLIEIKARNRTDVLKSINKYKPISEWDNIDL